MSCMQKATYKIIQPKEGYRRDYGDCGESFSVEDTIIP